MEAREEAVEVARVRDWGRFEKVLVEGEGEVCLFWKEKEGGGMAFLSNRRESGRAGCPILTDSPGSATVNASLII